MDITHSWDSDLSVGDEVMKYIGVISSGDSVNPQIDIGINPVQRRLPVSPDNTVFVSGQIRNLGSTILYATFYESGREYQQLPIFPSEQLTVKNMPAAILYLKSVDKGTKCDYFFSVTDSESEQEENQMLLFSNMTKQAVGSSPSPDPNPTGKKKVYLPAPANINKDTILIENFSGYRVDTVHTPDTLYNTWETHYDLFVTDGTAPAPTTSTYEKNLNAFKLVSTDANHLVLSNLDANLGMHKLIPYRERLETVRFRTQISFQPGLATDQRNCNFGLSSINHDRVQSQTSDFIILKNNDTTWLVRWQNVDGQNNTEQLGISPDTTEIDAEFLFYRKTQNATLNFYNWGTGELTQTFNFDNFNLNFYADLETDSIHPAWGVQAANGKNATMLIHNWELEVS